MVPAKERGSAFVRTRRKDLEWVFSIQHERTVNQDHPLALDHRLLQIQKTRWRNTLAGCKVTVYEPLGGAVVVRFGPHEGARFEPGALPARQPKRLFTPTVGAQTGGGGMNGTGAWFPLEAPPPNLRDSSLLGPECRLWRRGRCAAPANWIAWLHSGAWVDARVASLRRPIPAQVLRV